MEQNIGEWDTRVIRPHLKEMIDKILHSVALGEQRFAVEAVAEVFQEVKNPPLTLQSTTHTSAISVKQMTNNCICTSPSTIVNCLLYRP